MLGIVIPTLNSEAYIRETLDSLSLLSDYGCTVIVVDSGSVDSTVNIVSEYGYDLVYFPPGNMYSAINYGMSLLKNDWVTYINSDDLLNAGVLWDVLREFSVSADVIFGGVSYIDGAGVELYSRRALPVQLIPLFLNRGITVIPQAGTLYKREVFMRYNGFNDYYKYAADYDFFLRLANDESLVVGRTNKSLACFRLHERQLSTIYKTIMSDEVRDIMHSRAKGGVFGVGILRMIYWILNIDKILGPLLRAVYSTPFELLAMPAKRV